MDSNLLIKLPGLTITASNIKEYEVLLRTKYPRIAAEHLDGITKADRIALKKKQSEIKTKPKKDGIPKKGKE